MANSIRPAIQELEKLFRFFAPRFKREMPLPVITIQTQGRRQALGWFRDQSWKNEQKAALPEINLTAEYLGRSLEGVAETMLHEMVHYANRLSGVKDCSSNQYHNRKFKTLAEAVGLEVEEMDGKGWALTKLSKKTAREVKGAKVSEEAFRLFRVGEGSRPKVGSRMKKWVCPCGYIIRAAKDVDITCNECGGVFEKDEE